MDPLTVSAAIGAGSAAVSTMGDLAGDAKDRADAQSRERIARINADESETIALADLKRQIGNIKAIRASAGGSIDTPSFQAIIDSERAISDSNRRRKRTGYQLEEAQAKADARLIKNKAFFRIAGGALKGASSLASAIPEPE